MKLTTYEGNVMIEPANDLEKQEARAWLANERRSMFNSIESMKDAKHPEIIYGLKMQRSLLRIYDTLMELCEK